MVIVASRAVRIFIFLLLLVAYPTSYVFGSECSFLCVTLVHVNVHAYFRPHRKISPCVDLKNYNVQFQVFKTMQGAHGWIGPWLPITFLERKEYVK